MRSVWQRCALCLAQGLGVGLAPAAPGTFGSIIGMLVALFLVRHCSTNLAWVVCGMATLLAVAVCGTAEKMLKERDPASVVLDEIVAVPIVFLVARFALETFGSGEMKSMAMRPPFWAYAAGFGLFRAFDIAKPPPIRQSQKLPGGWGVVVDDTLAAIASGLCLSVALAWASVKHW